MHVNPVEWFLGSLDWATKMLQHLVKDLEIIYWMNDEHKEDCLERHMFYYIVSVGASVLALQRVHTRITLLCHSNNGNWQGCWNRSVLKLAAIFLGKNCDLAFHLNKCIEKLNETNADFMIICDIVERDSHNPHCYEYVLLISVWTNGTGKMNPSLIQCKFNNALVMSHHMVVYLPYCR